MKTLFDKRDSEQVAFHGVEADHFSHGYLGEKVAVQYEKRFVGRLRQQLERPGRSEPFILLNIMNRVCKSRHGVNRLADHFALVVQSQKYPCEPFVQKLIEKRKYDRSVANLYQRFWCIGRQSVKPRPEATDHDDGRQVVCR